MPAPVAHSCRPITGPELTSSSRTGRPSGSALYAQRNFLAADYGVAEARRRISPFTWLEAEAERTLSRAEQDIWDTARD